MRRRHFLTLAGTALAAPAFAAPPKSQMGIATTCYMTYWRPQDPMAFLERCHYLGAGGIQLQLPTDPQAVRQLRTKAEQYGMYIEAMAPMPRSNDQSAFEAALKTAKEAGAVAVRTGTSGGRRYEKWNSLNDWKAFVEESTSAIKKIPAIADRVKIPIGMENHKDWTIDEQVAIMKMYGGEYFGSLLDFGNNIALLDSPDSILELAPWVKLCHVKDMAVQNWPVREVKQGFLLSEVPLGEGILDLQKMMAVVRKSNPNSRFSLEMITRDPLEVPCLTDKFWVTFPERNGRFLARTLAMVEKEARRLQPLPRYSGMSKENQLAIEEENVKICLHYARVKLAL